MGSAYFPTKKGTDVFPADGPQAPTSNRRDGADPVSPGSNEVVNRTSSIVDAFVNAQRQNYANSVIGYHAQSLDHPDVHVRYINHNGAETVTVSPKPKAASPSNPQQVAEEVAYEHAHPEPPPLTQDHPSKYLMVLFKHDNKVDSNGKPAGDGIAAFKMTALTATGCGSADYVGRSQESKWVDTVGEILRVGQYDLNGQKVILAPIDFTGSAPQHLMLSTTDLTDSVETSADLSAPPLMNGNGADFFTIGGKYNKNQNQSGFTLQQATPYDGPNPITPYAIASDGTSYFWTEFTSNGMRIEIDLSQDGPYQKTGAFYTQLSDDTNNKIDFYPTPSVYVTYWDTNRQDYGANGYYATTLDAKRYVATIGEEKQGALISGESFYASAPYASLPKLATHKLYTSPYDISVFDIEANHNVVKPFTPTKGDHNIDNSLFLQSFDLSAAVPNVWEYKVTTSLDFAATQKLHTPLKVQGDWTTGGGTSHSGALYFANRYRFQGYSYDQQAQSSQNNIPGVTYDPVAHAGGLDQSPNVDGPLTAYNAMIGLAQGAPHFVAGKEWSMTTLGVAYNNSGFVSGSGDVSSVTDLNAQIWPADYAQVALGGANVGDHFYASNKHDPFLVQVDTAAYHSITQFSFVNITARMEFRGDDSGNQILPLPGDPVIRPKFRVHAFPPALSTRGEEPVPFFTLDGFGQDGKHAGTSYHTPYGSGYCKNYYSFTSWLHVSNGKHLIQGYYIDSTPYAFVDGSTKDGFLKSISKACGCADTEIVAMFMDIEMRTIKNIAKVKPGDYSASVFGGPPLPS